MRVMYAGTPDFAVPGLKALLDSDVDVVAVFTQPDRPAGRGKRLRASPVKRIALDHDIPVYQPVSLRADAAAPWLDVDADLAVVAAYGLLLPPDTLQSPRLGCVNIHASLLPRWRGAAPINRAIEAGDTETGITLMQMDEGLDTGAILARRQIPIDTQTTASTLHDALAEMGAQLLIDTLPAIHDQRIQPTPQIDANATYARKLSRAESPIDWQQPATTLQRRIRAFVPWPMVTGQHGDTTLKFWSSEALELHHNASPGTVVDTTADALVVACGQGALGLTRLQRPGSKPMAVRDFLNGYPILTGDQFVVTCGGDAHG